MATSSSHGETYGPCISQSKSKKNELLWGFGKKKKKGKVIRQSQRAVDRIMMEVRPALLSTTSKSVSGPPGFLK